MHYPRARVSAQGSRDSLNVSMQNSQDSQTEEKLLELKSQLAEQKQSNVKLSQLVLNLTNKLEEKETLLV